MKPTLKWIAGFYDGEGYVMITHGRQYQIRAGITNTDSRPLKWCLRHFGGAIVLNKHRTLTAKACRDWIVSSRKAAAFLTAVLPHLWLKRDQARVAIRFQEHVSAKKYGSRWGKTPDRVIAYRERQRLRLRALKARVC